CNGVPLLAISVTVLSALGPGRVATRLAGAIPGLCSGAIVLASTVSLPVAAVPVAAAFAAGAARRALRSHGFLSAAASAAEQEAPQLHEHANLLDWLRRRRRGFGGDGRRRRQAGHAGGDHGRRGSGGALFALGLIDRGRRRGRNQVARRAEFGQRGF